MGIIDGKRQGADATAVPVPLLKDAIGRRAETKTGQQKVQGRQNILPIWVYM